MVSVAKAAGYRWSVVSRVVAAACGGYVLINLANMALAVVLPVEQYRALLFAMQMSFVFYTLAIIWAFAARTATRAWLGLALVAAPLAIIDAWFYLGGSA
jgi:hypothetical protein